MIEPKMRAPGRGPFLSLALLALVFGVLMFAGALIAPPPVRTANQPGQFDAGAAQARLARILGDETPHPLDSAAQDVTRAALLREIEALGFRPQVRETFGCRPQPRAPLIDCGYVRNILFSIGPQSGPAILAATHYDSVPAAPGASDAGIGIATWLEVARLLRDESLVRRVVFLISDGEEPALLGAHVFASADPLMQSVEALVNLEARGTRGPAIFFESNQPNADAVAAYAQAPRPLANSVMADVYALLSNSTDVSALTRPGLDVINIAVLDGLEDYHTPQDSLASFSARSLRHMGDMTLATTRALAGAPDRGDATPRVYTDIASRLFISAPSWFGQAALGVAVLIALAAFWRVRGKRGWAALAAPSVALVAALAISAALGFALSFVRAGEEYWFAHPEPTRAWTALTALASAALALMLLRVRDGSSAAAAGALWFALIGFGLSFVLPGISILFALPAAVFAVGALIAFAWRPALMLGAVASLLVALLIWAPTLSLVELALGYAMPYATAGLIAVLCFNLFGILAWAQGAARWRWPLLAMACAIGVAIAFAVAAPSATAERPRPLNIVYFLDADSGEARLLAGSAERRLPASLAAALAFAPQRILPGDRFAYWAAPAALADAPRPTLEDISASEADGERIVRARLSMNGAYRALLRIPRAALARRASVNGVETSFADTGVSESSEFVSVACQGRSCDGASIWIVLDAAGENTDWALIGQTPGAHPAAAAAIAARGEAATPIQFGDATLTLQRLQME